MTSVSEHKIKHVFVNCPLLGEIREKYGIHDIENGIVNDFFFDRNGKDSWNKGLITVNMIIFSWIYIYALTFSSMCSLECGFFRLYASFQALFYFSVLHIYVIFLTSCICLFGYRYV